jgi:hypothetical protein
MLTHTAIGPNADGKFAVCYTTPGTNVATVVCDGCSQQAAMDEAALRNRQQVATGQALRSEHHACGIRDGVYPDLKKARKP